MLYATNLVIVIIYAITYAVIVNANGSAEEIVSYVPGNFLLFSIPFWVVTVAGVISKGKRSEIVGAFCGLHIVWFVICYMVLSSHSPESGNGWLLYIFGSPIGMVTGALTSRYIIQFLSAA